MCLAKIHVRVPLKIHERIVPVFVVVDVLRGRCAIFRPAFDVLATGNKQQAGYLIDRSADVDDRLAAS